MKRIISAIILSLGMFSAAFAQNPVAGAKAENVSIDRHGKYMSVDMLLNLLDLDVESNRAVVFTPVIKNGKDSVELESVGIYGRNRYIYYMRNQGSITGEKELTYKASDKPEKLQYNAIVPYEEWMDGSSLMLNRKDYGCCSKILDDESMLVDRFANRVFDAQLVFIHPQAEDRKERSIQGSAFVDFPVNITEIHPRYRNNTVELQKIFASIDSVKNDKDIVVSGISIKGYASPEATWEYNTSLAKGRTEALKKHVQELYNFDSDFIKTSYEPEDWDGFRKYMEKSTLANKDAILEIINSNMDPDTKDNTIKAKFPEDYKYILAYCYPALRHSDYKIDYVIVSYTDIEQIKQVMATAPYKLSLHEFYLLSKEYESGSDEFNNIFETAVRMYPNDEVANLNAANTAMQRNDLISAEKYLAKAGNSPEATYARGNLAALQKNWAEAEKCFTQAKEAGVAEAAAALEQVNSIR